MNYLSINSYFQKTKLLSTYEMLKFKSIQYNELTDSKIISNILQQTTYTPLPFLLKVKFVKTIKATIPQIQYQYIFPSERKIKSLKYSININRNSSAMTSTKEIYSTLLKI